MNLDASRFSLEGKVALIVGGAGDLGHAIVNRFAQAGATILLTSRKVENLEKVAAEINAKAARLLHSLLTLVRAKKSGR